MQVRTYLLFTGAKTLKILVFSDSHGSTLFMRRALNMHRDAEAVFFLGDGLADVDTLAYMFPNVAWIAVRGNNDFSGLFRGREVEELESIVLGGFKIVATHGNHYYVKHGTGAIKRLARQQEADIVLFGHTHTPYEEYVPDDAHPFYLFNPGAASGYAPSFGVITLDKTPLLSHGRFI